MHYGIGKTKSLVEKEGAKEILEIKEEGETRGRRN